jgi:hypothetical protein
LSGRLCGAKCVCPKLENIMIIFERPGLGRQIWVWVQRNFNSACQPRRTLQAETWIDCAEGDEVCRRYLWQRSVIASGAGAIRERNTVQATMEGSGKRRSSCTPQNQGPFKSKHNKSTGSSGGAGQSKHVCARVHVLALDPRLPPLRRVTWRNLRILKNNAQGVFHAVWNTPCAGFLKIRVQGADFFILMLRNPILHAVCLVERGRGHRASFIPGNEDTSFAGVEVIRTERFAAARAAELEEACALLPHRIAPAASRLSDMGTPPARMRLRRRAASYRPYKMPLSVRLNPRKKRRLSSGMGVRVPCRACRRAVRLLAAKQQADAGGQTAVRASPTPLLPTIVMPSTVAPPL